MSDLTDEFVGLVEVVVSPLVDYKEDLEIVAHETDDGDILVEISVNNDDIGKVIGRQGRVIKAIRTLARAAASRMGVSVDVELLD